MAPCSNSSGLRDTPTFVGAARISSATWRCPQIPLLVGYLACLHRPQIPLLVGYLPIRAVVNLPSRNTCTKPSPHTVPPAAVVPPFCATRAIVINHVAYTTWHHVVTQREECGAVRHLPFPRRGPAAVARYPYLWGSSYLGHLALSRYPYLSGICPFLRWQEDSDRAVVNLPSRNTCTNPVPTLFRQRPWFRPSVRREQSLSTMSRIQHGTMW